MKSASHKMEQQSSNPYRLAAGMIASDAWLLIILYPILVVPVVLEQWLQPTAFAPMAVALVLDRLCELAVLGIIGFRWIKRLHPDGTTPSPFTVATSLLVAGFLMWACVVIPLLLGMWADAEWSFVIGLCLLAPGTAFAFRHFFYFVPVLLGVRNIREILFEAREITAEDRLKPFKVLMAPFAIMLLFVTIAIAPAPDGRSLLFSSISSALTGIFWILSTYLGLAFGFTSVSLTRWRAHNMEPYRDERFDTISLQGSNFAAKLLTTRAGFRIMAVALFFMLGNYTRSATMVPAPHISLDSVAIQEKTVLVHLTLTDPSYNFRGFNTSSFMLAGESGVPISTETPKVTVEDDKAPFASSSSNSSKMSVLLEFKTERRREDLQQLEDLWLWYQFAKLFPISKQTLQGGPAPIQNPPQNFLDEDAVIPGESPVELRAVRFGSVGAIHSP